MRRFLLVFVLAFTLCMAVGCKSGSGEGGTNTLFKGASPETSAIALYKFDGKTTERSFLFDVQQEKELLDKLSKGKTTEVADYAPAWKDIPFYAIEVGNKDGFDIAVLYCGNYVITSDGTAYELACDIEKIVSEYSWRESDSFPGTIALPCSRYLALGQTGWNTDYMVEWDGYGLADGITVESVEATDNCKNVTITFRNDRDDDFIYGEGFTLLVKLNDRWYYVPSKDLLAFNEIAYILQPGQSIGKTYNLTAYGDLPAGDYMINNSGVTGEFSIK